MKITAINGSPRGKKSATCLMVEAFFEGARRQGAEVEHIFLSEKQIHPCRGCFTCWTHTPGTCVFQDDMKELSCRDSDLIVYATPLFVDNVSGLLKNFMDRSIVHANPLMGLDAGGEAVHPRRGPRPSIMVMANCGFPGQTHFDVLKLLFRRLARNMQTRLIAEIYRDEGPLLSAQDPALEPLVENYRQLLGQAGEEVVQYGMIRAELQKKLDAPLVSYDLYMQICNEYMGQFILERTQLSSGGYNAS